MIDICIQLANEIPFHPNANNVLRQLIKEHKDAKTKPAKSNKKPPKGPKSTPKSRAKPKKGKGEKGTKRRPQTDAPDNTAPTDTAAGRKPKKHKQRKNWTST